MLYQVVGLPWFWVCLLLAISLFLGLARRLAPVRWPKTSGVGHIQTTGLVSGLAAVAVAALAAALVGIYIRLDWLGMPSVNYLLSFFLTMAVVLGILRLIWPRDFAVPMVNGYPVVGSILQGMVIAGVFLLTVSASIHLHLGWFFPAIPDLLVLLVTAVGLWAYFLQEEGLKNALARTQGLFFALVLGLGSKLILGLVWYGTNYLPNPPSFVGITIPVALIGLLLVEALSAFLRDWRFGAIAISVFTAVVIAWTFSIILPFA
jgi:hypothetical protein